MLNNNFKPVQSLQRGLRLLEVISQSREGAFLKDLAREIECSPPAAYHLVNTLADSGFVQRLEDPVRYVLGDKFHQLTTNQGKDRFYKQVRQCLLRLGNQLPGIALYFSEYIGGSVVVRAQFSAQKSDQVIEGGNHVLPPYTSAGSLAHLAFWEQEIRDDYQSRYLFESYGLPFWKSRDAFDSAIDQMRKKKSFLMPHNPPLTLKLSAPLFHPGGNLAGALTLHWNLSAGDNLAQRKKQLLAAASSAGDNFTQSLSPS